SNGFSRKKVKMPITASSSSHASNSRQQLSPEQAGSSAFAIIKRKNKRALHLQQRCSRFETSYLSLKLFLRGKDLCANAPSLCFCCSAFCWPPQPGAGKTGSPTPG